MSNDHPSNYDPVIGGQEISLSPVLGGIEAIKSALRSNDYEVRIRVLNDALNYGEDGANLLITLMKKDKDWRVQYEAWKILLERGNTSVKDFQIPCRKIDNIRARYKAGERNFRWADLREAKLRWANLSEADLSGANLYWARLYEADLSETNLTGADLPGANLGRANLTWANLSGANLSQADLRRANLMWANLNQADLSGAYLYGVIIVDESTQTDPKWRLVCEIFNQDGYQKNLRNIDLSGANLSEANLEGTDLKAIAQHLHTDWTKLLQDFSNITLSNLGEQYYQECQRLQEQLDTQATQLTCQIQEQTFQKITPLLVQYPTLQQVVQQKRSDLPATTVLNLLKSLENLLQDWGIEPIGTPWQNVTFDPELHQPDAEDIYPGEAVYIRFIGYRTPTQVLVRAKVSRTLPEL